MNKILTSLASTALFISTLSADLVKVEMGVGAWENTSSGAMTYADRLNSGSDTSNEIEDTQGYAWVLVKHPIPILPNVRLEYVSTSSIGSAEGKFDEFIIPVGTTSKTLLDMTQYDVIPYYNLLDNTGWITLDLGLDFKFIESSYTADPTVGFDGYSESDTFVLPMLYLRTRLEIPSTNIGLEADVKYLSYDGSTVYDARVKVDYTLDFIPVIKPAIEVGYRMQSYDLDDGSGKNQLNSEYEGIYAGLMLRF